MTNILFSRALPGVWYMDRPVYIEVTRENNGSAVFFTYNTGDYGMASSIFLRWFVDYNNAIYWAATEAHNAPEIGEWKSRHSWSPA